MTFIVTNIIQLSELIKGFNI